jgi:hypothetical protein
MITIDALQTQRIAPIREAAYNFQGLPEPTQPNSKVFSFDGDLWLAQSYDESELFWGFLVECGADYIVLFRKLWQYIGTYHDAILVYRLIPGRG